MTRTKTLLLLAALMPAGASAFTIQGTMVKGTGRAPVQGVSVQLHVVRGDQEEKGATATTGPDGRYRFDGLRQDPAISYYVSTEYESAFYTEGPIEGKGETLTQDLTVYDVGRDISTVQIKNHHIIVERKPDGFHVTEILVFENRGAMAYLGTGPDHAESAGARVGLPASIQGFQQGMGGDPQSTHVRGRELSSERPIPPGVRPFSFSYRIPLSGRIDLSHRLYFPTASFVVLLDDPKLQLESKSLRAEGVRDQGGKQYAVYSGTGFGVGQEVSVRIGGAGFWSNPKVYPWVAAPFLIAGALWFAARRGRSSRESKEPQRPVASVTTLPLTPPPSAPSTDADFRKAYLMLIAALDEALERGEIPRETHGLIRQNLKRRLQALLSDEPASGVR
ncbi:MAG TPA: carboxypeptidase-like regulatory domain-containing protein [Candidatus Angelobacter sp.]|nr:carboxypeptidase-like regulatory domain-containing protein [Candidatus Angelobacter sp.]